MLTEQGALTAEKFANIKARVSMVTHILPGQPTRAEILADYSTRSGATVEDVLTLVAEVERLAAVEAERDRLLVLVAKAVGKKVTGRQFMLFCGVPWEAEDWWPQYEKAVMAYVKRGRALVEGAKYD